MTRSDSARVRMTAVAAVPGACPASRRSLVRGERKRREQVALLASRGAASASGGDHTARRWSSTGTHFTAKPDFVRRATVAFELEVIHRAGLVAWYVAGRPTFLLRRGCEAAGLSAINLERFSARPTQVAFNPVTSAGST